MRKFKMVAMTSFHATKCCHLVCEDWGVYIRLVAILSIYFLF